MHDFFYLFIHFLSWNPGMQLWIQKRLCDLDKIGLLYINMHHIFGIHVIYSFAQMYHFGCFLVYLAIYVYQGIYLLK